MRQQQTMHKMQYQSPAQPEQHPMHSVQQMHSPPLQHQLPQPQRSRKTIIPSHLLAALASTEHIQACLDENEQLILEILEHHSNGKSHEVVELEDRLRQNLKYLAGIADLQQQLESQMQEHRHHQHIQQQMMHHRQPFSPTPFSMRPGSSNGFRGGVALPQRSLFGSMLGGSSAGNPMGKMQGAAETQGNKRETGAASVSDNSSTGNSARSSTAGYCCVGSKQ